jgi:hypothetical protein
MFSHVFTSVIIPYFMALGTDQWRIAGAPIIEYVLETTLHLLYTLVR